MTEIAQLSSNGSGEWSLCPPCNPVEIIPLPKPIQTDLCPCPDLSPKIEANFIRQKRSIPKQSNGLHEMGFIMELSKIRVCRL